MCAVDEALPDAEEASKSDEGLVAEEVGRYAEVLPEAVAEKLVKIGHLQREDPALATMWTYLEQGQLPVDEKNAKRLVLESCNHDVIRGVLYYEPPTIPGCLCIVVPKKLRESFLQEAHAAS